MDEEKDFSETQNDSPAATEDDSKSAISADLIRGHINTIILRTLYERDKYGYEIIEEIERKSHGQYSLKQPTLYSALKRLESQGYINAYWKTDEVSLGGRRKYYTLTDSGREITEKNQAEWEYSRTVIDNLISDRSFDFTQPAPTAVDFKLLKKSTSRVPVIKDDDDEYDEDEEIKEEIKEVNDKTDDDEKVISLPEVEIKPETVTTYTEQVVYYDAPVLAATPASATTPAVAPETVTEEQKPEEPVETVQADNVDKITVEPNTVIEEQNVAERTVVEEKHEVHTVNEELAYKNNTAVEDKIVREPTMNEEQKRIVHENYMRLISEPVAPVQQEVDVVPVAEDIDTEKLIYNNKPETERDYKNLINNLFIRTTVRRNQPPVEEVEPTPPPAPAATTQFEDLNVKAENDGLKINTSDYVVSTRKKSYNRGGTLFKCSLIVAIVLLLEFTFCLIFKDDLGVNGVSLAYPFVIFALAAAQLLIFGVLYYTDLGKNTRKPSSSLYLSACIIVNVILIFVIFIISLLLQVNFSSVGDIFAKIIIPCITALNISLFGVCFYLFSK